MSFDEDKERVRQATDFVQLVSETVELRQRGQEFWGCCPFHGEKTPSFKVNPQTGLWHCFGCSEGGDVFSYVQKRESLDFGEALRYLADRAGIELSEERGRRGPKKSRLVEALIEAESFFSTQLMRGRSQGASAARAYLSGRGLGSQVCKRWGIGYAPGHGKLVAYLRDKGFSTSELVSADLAFERNGRLSDRFFDRVMFPIHDEVGRTIAFGGRILGKREGVAKYVNTRDTPAFNKGKHLFAYDKAKEAMAATGEAIVCEGYTDVISMHEAGFKNTVAALGTAFRLDHIRLLERQRVSKIICLFDGDSAGQRAAERAVRYLDKTTAAMLVVVLPDNLDPMEFLEARGVEALRPILSGARPLMDFVLESRLMSVDLTVPGGRVKALQDLAGVLAPLKDSVLLHDYATRLADTLGMDVESTKRAIKAAPIAKLDDESQASVVRKTQTETSRRRSQVPAIDEQVGFPGDYLPPEAQDEVAPVGLTTSWVSPSTDEQLQNTAEVELVSALAQYPDEVRPFGSRIATLSWVDSRHEAMAWAMLSTPEGTSPAKVVAAATAVTPDAPQILSSGRVMSETDRDTTGKIEFLVDTCELCSCRRRVRQIRLKLKGSQPTVSDEESQSLFAEATDLQHKIKELERKLS